MTARVIAVDFGKRQIPNGEYRCRIAEARSDGMRIAWRMQVMDGTCHEIRFTISVDDPDALCEAKALLEAIGMQPPYESNTEELVGRELIISVRDGWFDYLRIDG